MMLMGSGRCLVSKVHGPTFHPNEIAGTPSASALTSIGRAAFLSGCSARSSNDDGSQPTMTSSRRTPLPSSGQLRSAFGYAPMSPRSSRQCMSAILYLQIKPPKEWLMSTESQLCIRRHPIRNDGPLRCTITSLLPAIFVLLSNNILSYRLVQKKLVRPFVAANSDRHGLFEII